MENVLLKQLKKEQLDELIKRYYSSERVADLIEEYKLDVKVAELVKLFPLKVLDDFDCPYCCIPLRQRLPSKTAPKYWEPRPFCEECGHKEDEQCSCKSCVAVRNAKRDQLILNYQKKILQIQHKNINEIQITKLSLREALFLLGLCRAYRKEDSDLISAADFNFSQLAPTKLMTNELLKSLYSNQLIDIAISTPFGVINFDSGKPQYELTEIEWRLNFSSDELINIEFIEKLEIALRDKNSWPPTWQTELISIWNELALHECLRYMQVHIEDHNLEFRPGKKTISVMKFCLEHYSIVKCYYFVWVEVRNAASYFLRKNSTRRMASNIVIGNIQRRVERALAEEWDVPDYTKDSRCGESTLTALFSHVVTNLGQEFFRVKPNNKTLEVEEIVEL